MAWLKFEGTEDLIGQLKKNVEKKEVKRIVQVNSAELTNNAQRLAPVDTGALAGSIHQVLTDGGLTGRTRDGVAYGGYVDWGTRYMSANGFMINSFLLQSKKFKSDMEMLVK